MPCGSSSVARPDPGQLQELRRREGAAGQDHLAADEHTGRAPARPRRFASADRPRRRAAARGSRPRRRSSSSSKTTFVDERMRLHDEVAVRLGRRLQDVLARAVSAAVGRGQRHEPQARQAAVVRPASHSGRARCAGSGGSPRAREPRRMERCASSARAAAHRISAEQRRVVQARRWRRAGSSRASRRSRAGAGCRGAAATSGTYVHRSSRSKYPRIASPLQEASPSSSAIASQSELGPAIVIIALCAVQPPSVPARGYHTPPRS